MSSPLRGGTHHHGTDGTETEEEMIKRGKKERDKVSRKCYFGKITFLKKNLSEKPPKSEDGLFKKNPA